MLFSKQWFLAHQKILLGLLNTPVVSQVMRHIFCIDGNNSSLGKKKVLGILPHALFWAEGDQYVAEFRTHNKFSKRLYYSFYPLWWLAHQWDTLVANPLVPSLNLGFDTLTVFPDPSPETTSVDGQVGRGGVNQTYTNIRAGAGTTADDSGTTAITYLRSSTTSNQYQDLYRAFFLFDTSALTSVATVSAAVMSLKSSAKDNGLGSPAFNVVSSTPASNTAIAAGDFGSVGTTSFGSITYAALDAGGANYNDFTLNASGLAAISKTSITKFAIRDEWDRSGTFGGAWASVVVTWSQWISADTTGTSSDPKLVITYTLPSGKNFMLLGVG